MLARGVMIFALASAALAPADARKAAPAPLVRSGGLVDNVNGLSVDDRGQIVRFTGLVIDKEGRIERRLSANDTRPSAPEYRLDGKGRTLIPGFVDAHADLVRTGIVMMTLDLSDSATLDEAKAKISAYVQANSDRKWILGRGWDATRWGMSTPPSVADLDSITAGIPTFLESRDGKSGWANTAALRAANILPAGGTKARSYDGAEILRRLRAAVPAPTAKDRDIALDKAQRAFLAAGYTAVTDLSLGIDDWQALRRMGDRGALRLRIFGFARSLTDMLTIAGPEPTPWLYDDRLRLSGVAFPFAEPAPAPTSPQATTLLNQMSRAAMDGFQVGLDMGPTDSPALRDAALSMFAEMDATYKGDRRWRLDLLPPDDPSKPVKSITFLYSAPAVLTRGSMGSGSPASRPAPFRLFSMLVNPEDATSRGAALGALTRAPTYAAFAEKVTGSLEPGQRADFLLIDRDISAATPEGISATKVIENWIGGRRVYVSEAGR